MRRRSNAEAALAIRQVDRPGVVAALFDDRTGTDLALGELRSAGLESCTTRITGDGGECHGARQAGDGRPRLLRGIAAHGLLGVAFALVTYAALSGTAASVPAFAWIASGLGLGALTGFAREFLTKVRADSLSSPYFSERIQAGATLLAVDTRSVPVSMNTVESVFYRNGGHSIVTSSDEQHQRRPS